MIPKFSVQKPYTVIVGILLALVLGVVSLTRLSSDLLPEMNLPYAIVLTTYVGASPDTVEETLTIPLEETMATVSGISHISSNSSENYSLLILEFAEGTNMDSATVEMREKLDQLKSRWNDSTIGSPLIMKINPDMAPVVVAAVDMDGMDQKQLTAFVNDNLIAKLESMSGVASVSAAGQIEAEVQVIVRQELVDQLNARITAILDDQFRDAQRKLDEGAEQLEAGQNALDEQKHALAQQLAEGENQVVDGKILAISSKSQLEQQVALLKGILDRANEGLAQVEQAQARRDAIYPVIDALKPLLEQAAQLEATRAQAEAELRQLQAEDPTDLPTQPPTQAPTQAPTDAPTQSPTEEPTAFPTQIPEEATGAPTEAPTEPPTQPPTQPPTEVPTEPPTQAPTQPPTEVPTQLPSDGPSQSSPTGNRRQQRIAELEAIIEACDASLERIKAALAEQGIRVEEGQSVSSAISLKLAELEATVAGLEVVIANRDSLLETIDQVYPAYQQMNSALEQIESGEVALSDALTAINSSGILASIELGSAQAQLASAQSQLDSAQSQLDSAKKSAYDAADAEQILSVNTVMALLTAQNFEMPAGYLNMGDSSLLVRVGQPIQSLEELRQLPLINLGLEGLDTIRLSDVAEVVVQDNSEQVYAKVNGNGALILSVLKQNGYSTGDVSKAVQARFRALEQEYPGLHFSLLSDQGVYIDMVIHSVVQSMAYGAVLAVVVLFLFLKDLRPTMIIAVSIPVSAVLALVFLYMADVSINTMSLGGLSLGIGMLVDNSVVVLENIYRYRSMGYNIWSAAVAGTREVLGAIVASTLTTVCVFTGLFFTKGIVIDMLIDLALSFTFSLLGSLIIAMTFVPMTSSLLMRRDREITHPWFDRFADAYSRFLSLSLRWKPVVIAVAVALLVASSVLILRRGFSFLPEMASTQASITLSTPSELSFSQTMEIAEEVARRVGSIQDVETVSVQSGTSGMMGTLMGSMFGGFGGGDADANSASFYVVLSEQRTISNEELTAQILDKCADLNCTLDVSANSMDLSSLSGTGITVRIYGREKEQLQQLTRDLSDRLTKVEGVESVSSSLTSASDQLKVTVDKEKAARHSLTVAQVFQTIAAKIATPTSVATLHLEEGNFALYVKKDTDARMDRSQLEELILDPAAGQSSAMGGMGGSMMGGSAGSMSGFGSLSSAGEEEEEEQEQIHLRDVAEIAAVQGMDTIDRYNQQRYLSITANVAEGHNVTLVSNAIQASLNDYHFPDGYYVDYSGESETIMEAMFKLVEMLLLALVCIYLVMVAQFQSLLHPFIIMFTIPLAFTGGFIALLLAGRDISVLSMIGFVLLSGVIVNNGIVMIDFINQLRCRGMEKRAAILEAGRTRLRPVLMTTLTTIFAQTFMAMGNSMDAALLRPMALVTVGGLGYGTLMTLIFVPCIYDVFTSNKPMEVMEIDDTLISEADHQH